MKSLVTCVVGGCRVRAVSGYKEAGQPRAVSSQQGDVTSLGLAMPYLLVRESFLSTSCTVEGLPLNEARILGTIRTKHVSIIYYVCGHQVRNAATTPTSVTRRCGAWSSAPPPASSSSTASSSSATGSSPAAPSWPRRSPHPHQHSVVH